jgi:hypothetical protein
VTTVDIPAEAIAERVDRMRQVDFRKVVVRVLVFLALLPFVLIGRLGGIVVTATLYAVAAMQEGYAMQRGARKHEGA